MSSHTGFLALPIASCDLWQAHPAIGEALVQQETHGASLDI